MSKRRQILPTALVLSILLASPAMAQAPETHWKLWRAKDIATAAGAMPQLTRKGEALSGSTGCNTFTTTLTEQGSGKVSIERPALTRKFCGGMQQVVENAFLDALGRTAFVQEAGQRLTFLSEAREPLLVWRALRASASPRAQSNARPKQPGTTTRARVAKLHKQARKASPNRDAKKGCLFWMQWR